MNVLSLFSGIGGLELGLEWAGMTVVGQVEIDPYCQRVLAKHWPDVPRHDDVRTAADWWLAEERPTVDLICGGFPCQDISSAGRRAGIVNGTRSSLWTYMADTIRRIQPRYALLENVSALLVRGVDVVAADLAACGYDLRWDCIPAAAVGAPHRRDRWFGIAYPQRSELRLESVAERWRSRSAFAAADGFARHVADTDGQRQLQPSGTIGQERGRASDSGRTLANPDRLGWDGRTWLQRAAGWGHPADSGNTLADAGRAAQSLRVATPEQRTAEPRECRGSSRSRNDWWAVEPDVGRVANGIPARVDRLKALGNAVVPQVAQHIGEQLLAHLEAAA